MSKRLKNSNFEIFNYSTIMILIAIMLTPMVFSFPHARAATEFAFRTSQQVYVPGETLQVSGTAEPRQILIVRLYDPAGVTVRIENVEVDASGSFQGGVFV